MHNWCWNNLVINDSAASEKDQITHMNLIYMLITVITVGTRLFGWDPGIGSSHDNNRWNTSTDHRAICSSHTEWVSFAECDTEENVVWVVCYVSSIRNSTYESCQRVNPLRWQTPMAVPNHNDTTM